MPSFGPEASTGAELEHRHCRQFGVCGPLPTLLLTTTYCGTLLAWPTNGHHPLPTMYTSISRSTPPEGSDEWKIHIPLPFPYYGYNVDFALALEAALDRHIIDYKSYQNIRESVYGREVDWPQDLTPQHIRVDHEKRAQELLLDFQTSVTPESDTLTSDTKDTPPLSCDGKSTALCLQTASPRPVPTLHPDRFLNKKRTAEEIDQESEDRVLNEQPPIKKRKSTPFTPSNIPIEESFHGSALPCSLEQVNGRKMIRHEGPTQFSCWKDRYA